MSETRQLIFLSVSWLSACYFYVFQTLVRRIFGLQPVYQASTKLYINTSASFVKKTLANLKNIDNTARGLPIEYLQNTKRTELVNKYSVYRGVQIARMSLSEIEAVLLAIISTRSCMSKNWNTTFHHGSK
jgi:hypothetical protein